jgi:predicted dienelactone hydrolase
LGTASNTNTKNTYTLDQQSFSAIDVPYLVVTGTKDTTTGKPPDWRQDQFRYGPAPKYQVVINDANHFSYGDVAPLANQNTIKSLSHAFWDAYLLDDTSAQQWLASSDPQTWIGTTGAYSYAVS